MISTQYIGLYFVCIMSILQVRCTIVGQYYWIRIVKFHDFNIINILPYLITLINIRMQKSHSEWQFGIVNESDPKELRAVIQKLIDKSKILIENLDSTLSKLDKTQRQRQFWKQSYFSLKESCQKYIEANGIQPFHYIAALEEELKKEKVERTCLQEKFKVMCPTAKNRKTKMKTSYKPEQLTFTGENFVMQSVQKYGDKDKDRQNYRKAIYQSTLKRGDGFNKSISTVIFSKDKHNQSPAPEKGTGTPASSNGIVHLYDRSGGQVSIENKNRIGPKKIELFKFSQRQ